jgi:hypothetical protein
LYPLTKIIRENDLVAIAYEDANLNEKMEDEGDYLRDILVNGKSINEQFVLAGSYAPMIFDEKLVFFGVDNKGQTYFYFGDHYYLIPLESVINPRCCEPAMFKVSRSVDRVHAYGKKDDEWYYLDILIKETE